MSFCQVSRAIWPRDFTDDLKNTGKSFKNWNTCMNDKPCKIIAIVGIVLACIVGMWLIGGLLTCFRQGVTGIAEFCCWCCNCNRQSQRNDTMMMNNQGYIQPQNRMTSNGYQQVPDIVYQPIRYPESAYYGNGNDTSYYDESVKPNNNEVYEMEQDFDIEAQRQKPNNNKKKDVIYDLDSEDPVRDSFMQNAGSTTYLNGNYSTSTTHLNHSPVRNPPNHSPVRHGNMSNNNSNLNVGQARPYPEDSYFQSQPYSPIQNNSNKQHHNAGYYY